MTRSPNVRRGSRFGSARGFSLVELLIVVGLFAVVTAIAVGITPSIVSSAKGRSGADHVMSALRRSREMAISRRRNIRVTFQAPDQIAIEEINVPGPGTTPIETILLEGGVEFNDFEVGEDTRDGFGVGGGAVTVGGPLPVQFTPEGMFVDANGDPTNATVQVGLPDEELSATAITILGTTALIRDWRWNGRDWVE